RSECSCISPSVAPVRRSESFNAGPEKDFSVASGYAAWRPRDTEQSPYPADHRLDGRPGSDEPVWRAEMAKRLNFTIAATLVKLSVAEKVRISLVPIQMF